MEIMRADCTFGGSYTINFFYSFCVSRGQESLRIDPILTLLHSERPKLHTVLAFLSTRGLKSYLIQSSKQEFMHLLEQGIYCNMVNAPLIKKALVL